MDWHGCCCADGQSLFLESAFHPMGMSIREAGLDWTKVLCGSAINEQQMPNE